MEADFESRNALTAWLRRTRAGTLKRASREIPATMRREQSTGLLSDYAGAIFPPAATASQARDGAAARRDDAEEPAAFAGSVVEDRGAGERGLSAVDRRCGDYGSRGGEEDRAVQREGLLRSCGGAKTERRAERGHREARAVLSVPVAEPARDAGQVSERKRPRVGAGRTAEHGWMDVHSRATRET